MVTVTWIGETPVLPDHRCAYNETICVVVTIDARVVWSVFGKDLRREGDWLCLDEAVLPVRLVPGCDAHIVVSILSLPPLGSVIPPTGGSPYVSHAPGSHELDL